MFRLKSGAKVVHFSQTAKTFPRIFEKEAKLSVFSSRHDFCSFEDQKHFNMNILKIRRTMTDYDDALNDYDWYQNTG